MSVTVSAAVRNRLIAIAMLFAAIAFADFPTRVAAGTRPQVDLSLQVTTAPVPFVPGGHGTVTLTVHNAGPDTAGATVPGQDTIVAFEKWFDVTTRPPPFYILVQGLGCTIDTYISDPTIDGRIGLVYIFYFDPIAAGQSRACIYGIDFDSSTRESFPTNWYVSTSNEDDTDPSNDSVDYVFQAPAVSTSPRAIPTTSWQGLIALGIGLLAVAGRARLRKNRLAS